jgi:hypothetical protein
MSDMETVVDAPWPVDFTGKQPVSFTEFEVRDKPNGAWILLKFSGDGGDQASVSLNLFTSDITDGRKKANAISMRTLAGFFRAIGLSDADFPAASPAAIKTCLQAYVGEVRLQGKVGKDDKGYNTITQFYQS